jgi:hypothetical protein
LPTKKQLDKADKALKEFDWAKYDAMSDEEIRAHWAWDKDMAWPTEAELAEFKLVRPVRKRRKPPQAAE